MPQYTYQQHEDAYQRALAAGDEFAADQIAHELEAYPEFHESAYKKAEAAGDFSAQNTILQRYNDAFKRTHGGEIVDANLTEHKPFMENARKLWRAEHPDRKIEPGGTDLAEYAVGRMRDITFSTLDQGALIADMIRGGLSQEAGTALLQLGEVYDQMPNMTTKGWREGLMRTFNPAYSPDTYLTLGLGKLGVKGAGAVAKKAGWDLAEGQLEKQLLKKGVKKEVAQVAAREMAKKGVRTPGVRALEAAAYSGLEGAGYGALNDAARYQVPAIAAEQQDGWDYAQSLGAAAQGAGIGAAIGGAASIIPGRSTANVSKPTTVPQKARALASSLNPVRRSRFGVQPPSPKIAENLGDAARAATHMPAMDSLAKAATEVTGEAVGPGMRAILGEGDNLAKTLELATRKPLSRLKTFSDEMRVLVKSGDVPESLMTEFRSAQTAAKSKGRSIQDFTPDLSRVSPRAKKEVEKIVGGMREELKQLDEIALTSSRIIDQPGLAAHVGNMAAEVLTHGHLPAGYIMQAASSLLPKKGNQVAMAGRLVDRMEAAGNLQQVAQRVGPDTLGAVQGRATTQRVQAAQADKLAADISARQQQRAAAKGAAKDPIKLARERARLIKQGQAGTTKHGGIQGQFGTRFAADKPQVLRILSDMMGEAKAQGDRGWFKTLKRFRDDYSANLPTARKWRESKDVSKANYYRIQEEIAKRIRNGGRPMSYPAYKGYLKNVSTEGGKLANMAKARSHVLKQAYAKRKNELAAAATYGMPGEINAQVKSEAGRMAVLDALAGQ